ncbi:MAG: hypothetical protein IKF48_07050 [Oscillospiraceae bacterium]|nr:hypothetical protein [Oscillospiraceae bacterium]
MDNKTLALSLAACEKEADIIKLLKDERLWDDPTRWRNFGDNENNWSTIGNQQSDADAALVEKIVNSVDALLMKECMVRGISPSSDEAPHSIADALEQFYGITGGKIQNLTESQRTSLAQKNIILAATGEKDHPNFIIVDHGEGQSPQKMPVTILSINKSNKLKVPFVQGKFNMGGTGALSFCGSNNFQLIISKRCPDICEDDDSTHSLWGFTIVRRERPLPGTGLRSSKFTYLVGTDQNILSFSSDTMPIIPTSGDGFDDMEYGMYCKMYDYNLPGRMKSNINMALYYRLSMLLPNLAYPVYIDECRKGYRGHTMHRTLSGLNVRLSDQLGKEDSNIEEKVPVSFTIGGQKVDATVYVFKAKTSSGSKLDMSQYRGTEGVLLTQNGQTHGNYDKKFYNRSSVGLSYLSEYLLTVVDCTGIDEATREELFMNSRDRTRSSSFANKLESDLEEFLKENETLKQIQAKRREEAISDKLDDEKPLEDVLSSVFKSSSVLSKLFILGEKLKNPINLGQGSETEVFEGKYNPTFFTLIRPKKKTDVPFKRAAQIGRKCRIRFKTDACNDFFTREKYPGTFSLTRDGGACEDHFLNLRDGIAALNFELPADAKEGDEHSYVFTVIDTNNDNQFEETFEITVVENQEAPGGGGRRMPPDDGNKGKGSLTPAGISLPNVREVTHEDWDTYSFDKESALAILSAGDDVYDFYVNMENIHLQSELKPIAKNEAKMKLLKARYKYSMVLIGLSILGYSKNHQMPEDEKKSEIEDPEETVRLVTRMVSPVILPMIAVMGDDLSEIIE